jgi:hypothetical protein
MQKPILLILILGIIILTAVLLVFRMPKSTQISQPPVPEATSSVLPTRDPNVYKNTKYNFELSYPFNLTFKESSPEAVIIGNINDLQTESYVEIRVLFQQLSIGQKVSSASAEQFVLDNAKKLCKASGPNVDITCDKVEQLETIVTSNGHSAKTFYLSEKTVDSKTGVLKDAVLKGPFFSFDLSKNTPSSQSAILISPPVQKEQNSVNTTLIRDIADSLKITQISFPTPSIIPRRR